MIVMGGALYNFGLLLLQNSILWSLNSKIQANSWQLEETVWRKAEAVQVNILILAFFINKKPSKVQLLADAGQKSYE